MITTHDGLHRTCSDRSVVAPFASTRGMKPNTFAYRDKYSDGLENVTLKETVTLRMKIPAPSPSGRSTRSCRQSPASSNLPRQTKPSTLLSPPDQENARLAKMKRQRKSTTAKVNNYPPSRRNEFESCPTTNPSKVVQNQLMKRWWRERTNKTSLWNRSVNLGKNGLPMERSIRWMKRV